MTEMEALAERDGVPIVHWETGRLLAILCRTLDPVVLEVGTAIGYSTVHMAEQLRGGQWSPSSGTRSGLPRRAGFWTAPASPPAWISWRATRSRRSRRSRARSTCCS